jgi:hypothetical protein
MERKMEEIAKKEMSNFVEKKISRKEAIKRTGYMAASAATMMILLSNPSQAGGRHGHQSSPASKPPRHGNNGNNGNNGNHGDNDNRGNRGNRGRNDD